MLTSEDIKKITEAQVESQKDLFYTKYELDSKFSRILSHLDWLVKREKDREEARTIKGNRLERIESWIQRAAPKLGVEFEP